MKHRIGSLYAGHSDVIKFTCIEERSVIAELYCTCENSYMFRIYKCSLRQVGFVNWNRKIIKIVQQFVLHCVLIDSYSICHIQPDEGYICIDEICSCFYTYDKAIYRL